MPSSSVAGLRLQQSLALGVLLTLAITGCVPSVPPTPPGVRACLEPGAKAASAPSRGLLRVLPSSVPGVAIDSASWHTSASTEDLGANEFLSFRSTLRSERAIARGELAIVYEIDGRRPLVSADFLVLSGDGNVASSSDTAIVLQPSLPATYTRWVRVRTGYRITGPSAVSVCPNGTARLIRRNDIALYLEPRLQSDNGQAGGLNDGASATPLVVLGDTAVDIGIVNGLITGAVLNTADTTVHDVVVAAILDILVAGQRDTIEYELTAIPPHARAGFSGTSLNSPERIIGWTSYPASAVSRPIAGPADHHRASWVRQRLIPRPKSRWPYIDYPEDRGRRGCMADAPPLPSDPWKRVSGPGFTICLPAAWTDSAGTWRGPGATITPERVPPALPNGQPSWEEAGRYFWTMSSGDDLTVRFGRTNGALVTKAIWKGRKIRLSGFAVDSAAAALEYNIYGTVRFVTPLK